MFCKFDDNENGNVTVTVCGLGSYDIRDTLLCGQTFRFEAISEDDSEIEYLVTAMGELIYVAQRKRGELIFRNTTREFFESKIIPYFSLDLDLEAIRADVVSRTDSEWLKRAADVAAGVAILRQEPWETLFSFIISQNNNIPRIKKIIKKLAAEYGENICLQKGFKKCPLNKTDATPCNKICKECGVCYTFPRAEDVASCPEKMEGAKVGFRFKYLLDAATKVSSGEIDLDEIQRACDYNKTLDSLLKIKGVGLKVASCTALFGFFNLEAFPIDVWMKRAIDTYFDGNLDPLSLGKYAGVAQQYIFHYIRNLEGKDD